MGGGFAGVRAALDLTEYLSNRDDYEIILVDKKGYQTLHYALYEAATTEHALVGARKVKRSVTVSFEDIFSKTKVKVFKAYIEKVDLIEGKVITDSRVLSFDYLVIGMGSVADFYGIPGLDKYGFTLKSLEDAVMIRNRIEEVLTKKDEATIVIGGGGFAGVEFAGEVHNLLRHEAQHHQKDASKFKLVMVEGSPSCLFGLSEKVSALAVERLHKMGVETKFSTLISEANRDFVMLNKQERLDCDLLIWAGGVRSLRLPVVQDLERDKKDRTTVTPFLNLKLYQNAFIVGDVGGFVDPKTKKPVAQTAQEAIKQGTTAAKNVYRLINGKNLLPHHPGSTRFVIPVSGKYAILYTSNLIVSGFAGWGIRRLADLKYLVSILPFFKAIKYWIFENNLFIKND